METKPNVRSVTVWSAAASIAAFLAAVAPVVPDRYRALATSLGGIFAALAALRARKAGIDAARRAREE